MIQRCVICGDYHFIWNLGSGNRCFTCQRIPAKEQGIIRDIFKRWNVREF